MIKEYLTTDMSQHDIARKYSINQASISYYCKRNGIKIPTRKRRLKMVFKKRNRVKTNEIIIAKSWNKSTNFGRGAWQIDIYGITPKLRYEIEYILNKNNIRYYIMRGDKRYINFRWKLRAVSKTEDISEYIADLLSNFYVRIKGGNYEKNIVSQNNTQADSAESVA